MAVFGNFAIVDPKNHQRSEKLILSCEIFRGEIEMSRRGRRQKSKTARRVKSLRAVTEYTKRFLEGKNAKRNRLHWEDGWKGKMIKRKVRKSIFCSALECDISSERTIKSTREIEPQTVVMKKKSIARSLVHISNGNSKIDNKRYLVTKFNDSVDDTARV